MIAQVYTSISDANCLKATGNSSWPLTSSSYKSMPGLHLGTCLEHHAQILIFAIHTHEGTVLDPGPTDWHNYSHSGLFGIHTCARVR